MQLAPDTETEEEDRDSVVKCKGMDDVEDVWRTLDASWLDMEGVDDGEVLSIKVMRAEEEESPKCLADEEEFLAWRERKEFDRKKGR
jgi:hypothetical protein